MTRASNEPLISVIIPVYKVEKYLNKCVDSVLNQTYKNLEIILVDDGSPDKCPEICDEYAKKDDRIKIIHKQNGGLSDARNVGIEKSTGEYITFIDSDDYVDSNYIEQLYKLFDILYRVIHFVLMILAFSLAFFHVFQGLIAMSRLSQI